MPFFKPVSSQVSFPSIEKEVLEFWQSNEIFRKSLESTQSNRAYVFYDGPPFATGLPHYGHLLAGTLKDIIPRFWTMRGNYVGRRFGWDCHGLPVENEMEKELGVSGKRDIEKLGIHIFNEACRSIVLRYTSQWKDVVLRMGRWVDFDNQYRTMDPAYMESIWWVFKQVWDKNLIYQGFRVQPYCPRCATPLSNFEVNEGYRDVTGPSITVSFPLVDDPTTKILVWTTTPWTLPSNVALAVGADIRYVKIRDAAGTFILAKDRLSAYYKKEADYEILEEIAGEKIAGLRYEPLFTYFAGRSEKFFTVTTADFVSTEDGTGIVHIAPAFGEDDFQVGQKLGLPMVCPVDDTGKFTDEVFPWAGKLVFDADDAIIRTLKEMGRLYQRSSIQHRYPHCYRCDTALIYKAITTWFMKIEPLKKNMLANNQTIHWVPEHLRDGRFGKGVESAPDWNISRNRYWGTPLPIWTCSCGHRECLGSIADLHRLAGNGDSAQGAKAHREAIATLKESLRNETRSRLEQCGMEVSWAARVESAEIPDNDLHRHVIDLLTLSCPQCGQPMQRTSEVLDCWFESGSMPYAQNHYPFEKAQEFEKHFPADFIAEGLDQTRGWFYTLTVLASALFDKTAFKNVVVNGIILAEDGRKLSKRLKNYTPPVDILEKMGADALRLFLVNSPAVKAEDLRFSEKGVLEMSKAILLPFWNAYSFFVTYANVDNWQPQPGVKPRSDNELDRWILSLLNHVVSAVTKEMEQYNLYRVVPHLVDFIESLTNWYIRRSRRRFWKSGNDADKESAYQTLYYVLVEFSKIMAPFLPFLTDAIYRNLAGEKLSGGLSSVHLASYPQPDPSYDNPDLETKMSLVRGAVTMGRALRSRYNLKTRQPLREFTIIIRDDAKRALVSDMAPLIKEELNVKSVRFDKNEDSVVTLSVKPNYRKLGKVFGKSMKDAAAMIEALSVDQIESILGGGSLQVLGNSLTAEDMEIRRTKHEGMEVETEGEVTVALDTEITPELRDEGIAREFVNRVQTLRKTRALNVTDRISIGCEAPETITRAVSTFADYVKSETLATALSWSSVPTDQQSEEIEIDDMKARLWIAVSGS